MGMMGMMGGDMGSPCEGSVASDGRILRVGSAGETTSTYNGDGFVTGPQRESTMDSDVRVRCGLSPAESKLVYVDKHWVADSRPHGRRPATNLRINFCSDSCKKC